MMKSSLMRINLIVILLASFIPNLASAELKTFITEYTYQASEYDSKVTCRTLALEQVKRLLLEELGTYLESHTEIVNYKLTRDQIITLTAGVVRANIMTEKWDGERYWLKAKIDADPEDVVKAVNDLRKDLQATRELEEGRKKVKELMLEIERLKTQFSKDGSNKDLVAQYLKSTEELNAFDIYHRCIELSVAGKLQEALQEVNGAIKKTPKNSLAYVIRGHLNARLGNYAMAIEDSNRAIGLDPKSATAYANRAYVYYRLREFDKVLEDSNKSIKLDYHFAMAYLLRAGSFYWMGNYEKTWEDVQKAVELNPDNALVYVGRGAYHMALGNKLQAYSDISKASKLDPDNPEVLIAQAAYEINSGNLKEGLNYINRAIQIDPYLPLAYYNRGVVYREMGKKDQALTDLDRAIELAPNFALARILLIKLR
jgi:tetratricopeptide (TPR) repeat protein